ncbi:hypothetical protein GH733_017731, partial [Mirounga leonina]
MIHHGVSSSKMGDIKQSYLETFISNSNKVELALTSDGRTIVCYHPSVDIPYEHT